MELMENSRKENKSTKEPRIMEQLRIMIFSRRDFLCLVFILFKTPLKNYITEFSGE